MFATMAGNKDDATAANSGQTTSNISKSSKTAAAIAAAAAAKQSNKNPANNTTTTTTNATTSMSSKTATSSASFASGGNVKDTNPISESEVRRYLERKPMTTKELYQKFRSKTQNTLTKDELLNSLKCALDKLQTKMFEKNGSNYIMLKD